MKLFWSAKSIPALAELPPAQRKTAWRFGYFKIIRHWQYWCASVAVYGIPIGIGLSIFPQEPVIGAALGGGIGGFIQWQLAAHQMLPYLQEYMEHWRANEQNAAETRRHLQQLQNQG